MLDKDCNLVVFILESCSILTSEQIQLIREHLAYNYKIIDRVLICLSIKTKVLSQPENEFVGIIIDEAANETLIHRLYAENSSAQILDDFNNQGSVPAKMILDKLGELFKLDIDVLSGKRKLDLGIVCPAEIMPKDDELVKEVIEFNKRRPDWSVELFATDEGDDTSIQDAVQHLLKNKRVYLKSEAHLTSITDELIYNPLGVDGIRAFIYVIDHNMVKFPGDIDSIFKYINEKGRDALINEFIEQSINSSTVITDTPYYVSILKDRKKNRKLGPALIDRYEQFTFKVFKQMFIYDLFVQIAETTSHADKFDYSPAYKLNVYCLDSLIHHIADSTFDYFTGHKDSGISVWKFLKQTDMGEKLYATVDDVTAVEIDPSVEFDLTDMSDYIEVEAEQDFYRRLALAAPAPLTLDNDSELLRLILAVENLGYSFTLSGEEKKYSLNTKDRPSMPKFGENSILI